MPQEKKGLMHLNPSKIYTSEDVEIPEFLPNKPKIKNEIVNYHNSVKRGDDCVGAILEALDSNTNYKNTIVILFVRSWYAITLCQINGVSERAKSSFFDALARTN